MKETVEDLREKDKCFLDKDMDLHESYGMISIGNISCGGKGQALFGSGINHNHFISLEIHTAERIRDAYTDHYFSKDKITEVFLSATQFAGLITRSNTSGVPCTLKWTQEKGHIKDVPQHNIKKEMHADLKRKFKNVGKRVKAMQDTIEECLTGTVKKADKDTIKSAINRIYNDVNSNLAYLQECQTEKLEKIGTEIVAEAEANITGLIKGLGLDELKNKLFI